MRVLNDAQHHNKFKINMTEVCGTAKQSTLKNTKITLSMRLV